MVGLGSLAIQFLPNIIHSPPPGETFLKFHSNMYLHPSSIHDRNMYLFKFFSFFLARKLRKGSVSSLKYNSMYNKLYIEDLILNLKKSKLSRRTSYNYTTMNVKRIIIIMFMRVQ